MPNTQDLELAITKLQEAATHYDQGRSKLNSLSMMLRDMKAGKPVEKPPVPDLWQPLTPKRPHHPQWPEDGYQSYALPVRLDPGELRATIPVPIDLDTSSSYNLLWVAPFKNDNGYSLEWAETVIYLRYVRGKLKLTVAGSDTVIGFGPRGRTLQVYVTPEGVRVESDPHPVLRRHWERDLGDLFDGNLGAWIDQPNTNLDGALPHRNAGIKAPTLAMRPHLQST
jgi:hypothetical protein